ncbi:hypothetical protein [Shewanella baltica]|uniref:hypothetical protein n=1 Tax=Shewanella baltica TaxID=62322 RepID=UPI00217D928C|nr:hypothetical protein [Shewanella baltica]
MKIIKKIALLLCLLSPLSQAETTLFGLTLGKSTRQEAEQTYTLQNERARPGLPNRSYYNVSGNQFKEPQLEVATLYFDDTQTLEGILFTFPPSVQKYKELKDQLSRQYPLLKMEPFVSDPLRIIDKVEFRNDTTHVSLTYDYHGIFLGFTNL